MQALYYILLTDIYSHMKGREQYGKVGDRVTLIGLHDDILIVENSHGNRFPVHSKEVDFYKQIEEPVTVAEVEEKQVVVPVIIKKQKRVVVNQSQLF